MFSALFSILKITMSCLVIWCVAMALQCKPVAPWLAWMTSIILVANIANAARGGTKE